MQQMAFRLHHQRADLEGWLASENLLSAPAT
jgi:hypothetical protein